MVVSAADEPIQFSIFPTRLFTTRRFFVMLTTETRLRLQNIIARIAACEPVSLHERIYVQKFADRDASVWSWLRQAQR